MAKFFLVTLISCALQLTFTPAFAVNEPARPPKVDPELHFCDAPAPDDFQVANIGSDFVSLAWVPAWVGAVHTLEISIEDSDNWVTLMINYNVPGASFTLYNLDPGYYRARIVTNCSTGETSSNLSEVQFEFKIIDLSTAGRIPMNPVSVDDCEKIDYLNHEWVGFEVTEIETGVSNLFEFTYTEGENPVLKRVSYNHPIVAVDNSGKFPTNDAPILKTPSPIRVDDIPQWNPDNVINIGYVICLDNFSASPTITLCKDEDNPFLDWKPEYSFTALTAEDIVSDAPNSGSTDKSIRDTIDFVKIKAQTPFKESLNVFFPQILLDGSKTTIQLFNTNGQMIMLYNFDLNISQISLPTASLQPGIYILQVETNFGVQNLRIVKSH